MLGAMTRPERTDGTFDGQLLALNARIDALLEVATRARRSLAPTVLSIVESVVADFGLTGAFVHTIGEDREAHTFASGRAAGLPIVDAFIRENRASAGALLSPETSGAVVSTDGMLRLVGRSLDVAGEWFGCAGFVVAADRSEDLEFLGRALATMCEVLDNFLQTVRGARDKHRIMMELSSALQNRVLVDGLDEAVRILSKSVPFDRLMIALRADTAPGAAVHVQVYEASNGIVSRSCDTIGTAAVSVAHDSLRREARAYLDGGPSARIADIIGLTRIQEEVLIHGVRDARLVGKILVSAPPDGFNTYDRELFASFASFICQRVVDFSREYAERYLIPREGTAAILFTDISGFTKISETVLVDPRQIGRLIDLWGERAVEILWEHGGVFDKMVGDCVIGLFGPPFFEDDPAKTLSRAIRAAMAIRAMTNALPNDPEFAVLRESGLAVSTGVHHAPLFVGRFGPNENFTGFSSGMNNTARLQAQAGRNEIVVMAEAVALLGSPSPFRFGAARSAVVKNVANPLEFFPLEDATV
jgi:adenylate cyclase